MTIPKLEQRVEIIAKEVEKLNSEVSGDTYTKAEADARFIKDESPYFTLNGIRVYVSSTAPTGDIPEGSVGLGW